MRQAELDSYYAEVTKLWHGIKADDPAATVAVDMAVLIADFLSASNTEATWTDYVHRVGELAMKYPDGPPKIMLDWLTHEVACAIERKKVSDVVA